MSRKRFVVSLADDAHSQKLSDERCQIAFTLTPTEITENTKPYTLYETVHPTVWSIYDCSYGEPQRLDCDVHLGVATVQKTQDNLIIPSLSRFIPPGYYTALTRIHHRIEWCDVARWRSDMPTTVIITNDSKAEQAFALCLAVVEKYEHEPKFVPITLFNKIPHERRVHVKAEFKLHAYWGTGIREMEQIHKGQLEPVLNDNNDPWEILVDELPTMTAFRISRTSSGRIIISQCESEASNAAREMLEDVGKLKEQLNMLQKSVTNALGTDYGAISRLKRGIDQMTKKADDIRVDLDDSTGKVREFDRKVYSIENTVADCQDAISRLRAPASTRSDLAAQVETISKTLHDLSKAQDMTRVHTSIRVMEEKMQGLGDSLSGLPKLHSNVGQLTVKVQTMTEDMASMDTAVANINRRITTVDSTVQEHDTRVAAVEGTLSGMKRTVAEVQNDVDRTASLVGDVSSQLKEKADVESLEKVQEDVKATATSVKEVGKVAEGARTEIDGMTGKLERVEGSMTRVDGRVKGLIARMEGLEAKDTKSDYARVEKSVTDVTRRVGEVEDNVKKLTLTASDVTSNKAELTALRKSLGEVSTMAQNATRAATTLQANMGGMSSDMGLVKRQVMAIEGNVKMVEGSLKAVDLAVQNVEKEFKNMGLKSFIGTRFGWK
ncbi:hypothetical protein BXZ70DRAFT_96907 [Cristinia sonorae]|uniref:Uncharacterized protein n=1 Tax=Cristinia sonorae TaxID=1940300 RepID=A0A8K0XQN2_9AGAR|nr:hypothetical protein BXZ70DRAFT_96907 [Cristinia sonorae]